MFRKLVFIAAVLTAPLHAQQRDQIVIDRDKLGHLLAETPEQTDTVQSLVDWRASSPLLDFAVHGAHVCFAGPPGSYVLMRDVTTITIELDEQQRFRRFRVDRQTRGTEITIRGVQTPVPSDPAPVDPTPKKITRVTYVFEKDSHHVPRPVALALQRLNAAGIMASEFEEDTLDGSGRIPEQYAIPLAAAQQAGLPALVVQSHFAVVRVLKNPQTETEVMEAAK